MSVTWTAAQHDGVDWGGLLPRLQTAATHAEVLDAARSPRATTPTHRHHRLHGRELDGGADGGVSGRHSPRALSPTFRHASIDMHRKPPAAAPSARSAARASSPTFRHSPIF